MIVLNESGTPQLNTVHHCRAEALLSALDTASVDLVVTSPPYDQLRSYNGFSWNFEYIAQQTYRVLKPGGVLVWVVGDTRSLDGMRQAIYFHDMTGLKVHQRIVWEKNGLPQKRPQAYMPDFEDMFVISKGEPKTFNPILKRNKTAGATYKKGHNGKHGYQWSGGHGITPDESMLTNVWNIGVGGAKTTIDDVDHPAMFPEALAERHILTWSNAGDVVLDFFGGSGTTAKMARKNGRDYLTCDISREYCDLMERRLAAPYTPSFMPQLESA